MTAGAMVDLESVLSEARPVDRPLDFLNNEFVPSLTDETMDVVNPATGRNIGIVSAGYWNTGQDCGAACRILVAESVADDVLDLMRQRAESLMWGIPPKVITLRSAPWSAVSSCRR